MTSQRFSVFLSCGLCFLSRLPITEFGSIVQSTCSSRPAIDGTLRTRSLWCRRLIGLVVEARWIRALVGVNYRVAPQQRVPLISGTKTTATPALAQSLLSCGSKSSGRQRQSRRNLTIQIRNELAELSVEDAIRSDPSHRDWTTRLGR